MASTMIEAYLSARRNDTLTRSIRSEKVSREERAARRRARWERRMLQEHYLRTSQMADYYDEETA